MVLRQLPGCSLAMLAVACAGAARFDPRLPTARESRQLVPILRQWSGDGPVATSPWCGVARGVGDWRALQARLGPAADCFGSDFVPPVGALVLAVVAPAGPRTATPAVRVATEEGVDVLTFTAVGAGAHGAPTWVLVLPERRQQLAVVLAMPTPAFPVPIETLLQVIEPR